MSDPQESEVHAEAGYMRSKTFCGEPGKKVVIRTPDDWLKVTCFGCSYAAERNK